MTRSSSTHRFSSLWLLFLALCPCNAFAPLGNGIAQQHGRLYQSSFSQEPPSSTNNNPASSSVDAMRNDIEAMRREAQRRLDALTMDLQEFQSAKESYKLGDANRQSAQSSSSSSLDCLEGDLTKMPTTTYMPEAKTKKLNEEDRAMEQIFSKAPAAPSTTVIFDPPVNVHLLENTRWKIVFNLGREPGTWMPPTWGASGDRLRFTVEVDLLDEPLNDREDFLEGMAGAKKLRVREAWIQSTFDSDYHGRRNLRVAPTGGYKVVRGAGPLGTDVFRFYIEAEESFRSSAASDVYCPRGRIYGNCGYFPTLDPEVRDSFHAYKDRLQKEYRAMALKYERLQLENEEDARLISWEKVGRMKDEVKLRKQLKELDRKIQEARQREPEKAQLRMSRKGDVGLTRDGGVCCKVQKGLALEYHILGRMEIAAVEKDHGDIHEDYNDLVDKLHP